jgi:hypothetical protein
MLKLPGWWSRTRTTARTRDRSSSLEAFPSERFYPVDDAWPQDDRSSNRRDRTFRLPALIGILISALAVSGYLVHKWGPFKLEAASASLTIESDPDGAEVFSAGVRQGTTPLTVSVAPGPHTFELVSGTRRKAFRVEARAGVSVVHHLQFEAPPPTKAWLSVVTEPASLRVLLDGKPLGVSPLLATDLEPGARKLQVVGSRGTAEQRVDLYAGETASVFISAPMPAAPAGPAAGWLTVTSPVALQIIEGGNVIGTTPSSKLLVPVGTHDLQLVNETLGILENRRIQINPGATATIAIDVPKAPLSMNARPWAEAWLDGKHVGETPIANHQVFVGTHEVLFRHPELGERRQTVTVSLKTPARVSVDMRKPQ